MKETKLGLKIHFLEKLIRSRIEQEVKKEKTYTSAEGRLLHYLLGQKDNCDIFQKDIEAVFNIKRSTATELLQSLEKKEYIKRVPMQKDARLKKIILLQKAKSLEPDVERFLNNLDETLKKNLTAEEVEVFEKAINQMIKNIEGADV